MTNKVDHTLINNLIGLGLSKNEALIYMTLLDLGESPAGQIIKKTALHRQVVYNDLEKLNKKGMVNVLKKPNKAYYQAESPDRILDNLKEKQKLAKSLIPELKLIANPKTRQQIRIYQGWQEFQLMHKENLKRQPKNSILKVIGAGMFRWLELMQRGGFLRRYDRARIKKDISHWLIIYANQKKDLDLISQAPSNQTEYGSSKFRILPEEFCSPIGIHVWAHCIELIIYEDEVIVFEIKNSKVVKNFEKYFDIMWNIAKYP